MTGVFDRAHKIIGGDGLPVVLLKIMRAAFKKCLLTDEPAQHPHDLGAFDVDRERVEVVDLNKGIGAHRMGHGAGILSKLLRAHKVGVLNALNPGRAMIGAELLLAKDREAFF